MAITQHADIYVSGVDIYSDDMLVYNNLVDRRQIPMIWGSGPTLYLKHSETDPGMEIPSYGFMTGAKEVLCLEFWVAFGNIDVQEFSGTILSSSKELIRFSPYSSLRIFRNQLVLTHYDEYLVASFERFGSALLVNINYNRKTDGIHASILVDGKIIGSKKFKYISQDAETRLIKFINQSNYKVVYGPVVMYPYNITTNMATKHYVYGQGTSQPLSYKTMAGNGAIELGNKFTKRGQQTVSVPAALSWDSGIINNLSTASNVIGFVPRSKPIKIVNRDGVERYYFNHFQDYYSSSKYGIGLQAYVKKNTPDPKYVLAVLRLDKDFIVIYVKDMKISVDYKIKEDHKYEVLTIPITAPLTYDTYDVNVSLLFDKLFEVTGSPGRYLVNNVQTKLTVGYIDEDINADVREDGESISKDYYLNLPGLGQEVYIVRFLTKTSQIDNEQILTENVCQNGAVNWYQAEQNYYQVGHWAKEFPISLLTEQISYANEGGYENLQEQLNYIQYNIDNYEDTVSYIMIKDAAQPELLLPPIDNQLIFDDVSTFLGRYIEIQNNEILKLPIIPVEQYKNLIVRILVTIKSNILHPVSTQAKIKEIKFTGQSVPRAKPLIIGNVTDQDIATFERTDDMVFPKWNTDVLLNIPVLNMPFYYLNHGLAYYLVDDGKYNVNYWDRGFLLTKYFSEDGSDQVYGFSTLMYVEKRSPTISKLMRLNYVDYTQPNKLGYIEIKWNENTFEIIPHPSVENIIDVYIDYEKVEPGAIYSVDKWYALTAIYKPGKISWNENQTKALHLEFLTPNVYFTVFNILSVNNLFENRFIIDYYIASNQIVKYLLSSLTGSYSEIMYTTDSQEWVPIMQNAWTSAYINVTWDHISVEERT